MHLDQNCGSNGVQNPPKITKKEVFFESVKDFGKEIRHIAQTKAFHTFLHDSRKKYQFWCMYVDQISSKCKVQNLLKSSWI